MITTANYILERLRVELKDEYAPFFWSESELLSYIDEAQTEFCREVPIRDSRTEEICVIPYKALDTEIPFHESIIRILSALRVDADGRKYNIRLATQENAVSLQSAKRPDYGFQLEGARELTRPSDNFLLFVDYDEAFLRLSSPAETLGTLELQVERLPLEPLDNCKDPLEIRREYIPALIAWAGFRAWMKQDAETFDENASSRSFDLFQNHVARAKTEKNRRQSQPGIVRYGGL